MRIKRTRGLPAVAAAGMLPLGLAGAASAAAPLAAVTVTGGALSITHSVS